MIKTISEKCSDFLNQSRKQPMLKILPRKLNNFAKVKVRKQKKINEIDKIFNNTFEHHLLKQRCIISYTENTLPIATEHTEPFYVFPINGYRLLYSKGVENQKETYNETFNSLQREMGLNPSKKLLSDVMKFNYSNDNLFDALKHDCEIIIYNISYYYALKKSNIDNYTGFVQNMCESENLWSNE